MKIKLKRQVKGSKGDVVNPGEVFEVIEVLHKRRLYLIDACKKMWFIDFKDCEVG